MRSRKKRSTCGGVEERQSMCRGVSYVVTSTAFIFKISIGGRNNRICSKFSEGRSNIETGHIANSVRRGGCW